MTKKEKKHVDECIQTEGFDYTFIHYSSFKDVEDEEFHRLRLAYVNAQKELEKYLEEQGINLDY